MTSHFFKLIWKKRRKNSLLIIEIFISFMVLFAIFSSLIYNYSNYFQGLGYDYKDAWIINFDWPNTESEIAYEKLKTVRQHVLSHREVISGSFCKGTYPFSFTSMTWKENDVELEYVGCDTSYFSVLKISFVEGRSFCADDRMLKKKPVVLSRKAAEQFFGNQLAAGRIFGDDSDLVVTGVVDKYRYRSSYMANEPTIFTFSDVSDSSVSHLNNFLIRVRSGTGRAFEAGLMREIQQIVPGWDIEIQWLDDLRKTKDNMAMGFIWILIIVAVFLILNVILGLFGLLWYNINLRKPEIGLRRALGSSKKGITGHFIKETLVLTTFAVILGIPFAIQFPAMGVFNIRPGIYLAAIACSLIFLYGLIFLSSLVPSRQASEVEPATALYEE
jgi:putative ABC transport system permease protein